MRKYLIGFAFFGIVFALSFMSMSLLGFALGVHAQLADTPGPVSDVALMGLLGFVAQFITSVKVGGFVSWFIQKMKDSKLATFNWIGANTPWVSKVIALVGAVATASGISWTYTGGDLLIHGLGIAMLANLWHVAVNYLIQHGWYKSVFAPEPVVVNNTNVK